MASNKQSEGGDGYYSSIAPVDAAITNCAPAITNRAPGTTNPFTQSTVTIFILV